MSTQDAAHPSFSVNLYDRDGDMYCEGIYLHYGDTIIKIATTLNGFNAHVQHLEKIAKEISEC